MDKKTVTLAELERLVLDAAKARPTTADVCAVSIGLRPTEGERGASPHDWFVEHFSRTAASSPAGLDNAAVARELHDLASRLRQVYAVDS